MDASTASPWLCEKTLYQLVNDTSEELLVQLAQLFFEEAEQRSRVIAASRRQQDWGRIQQELHTLKSNAGTLGALPLQQLCREAELACRAGDHASVDRLLVRIHDVQQQTIAALRSRVQADATL